MLHFFVRFYISVSGALVLCLALAATYERVRSWHLLYGVLTICVVVSEKVDVAFSKGILRILSTMIGGTLGEASSLDITLYS